MPHSASTFDDLCARIIDQITPRTVLDVGCGSGKYADIVRQNHPKAHIIGYELEPSYVSQYRLNEKYDELRCESVDRILASNVQDRFDLCIFGDVLEHLRKSVGQDVIHFLLYRSRYIMLVVPVQYLQNDHCGVRSEAHISSWHPKEFHLYADGVHVSRERTWFSILRGFLSTRPEFLELRASIEKLENNVEHFTCSDL